MKRVFRSHRHKNPHQHGENEKKQIPFFSKESRSPFFNAGIQTKKDTATGSLKVGKPGDKYEKEADRVADAVVNHSTSKPAIQNKEISSIQRVTLATPQEDEKLGTAEQRMEEDKLVQEKPELQKIEEPKEEEMIHKMGGGREEEEMLSKKEVPEEEEEGMINKLEGEEEEEGPVQTKSENATRSAGSTVTRQIKNKSGRGKRLPKHTKAEMEASFGVDFSYVNIHTDAEAVSLNKKLGAQAFTHGKDVYFNQGKYDPGSSKGKHLLAHELTHVVQQTRGSDGITPKLQRQTGSSPVPTTCGKPAECPDTFCKPLPHPSMAIIARNTTASFLLAGIAKEVSPRVVPLWALYLFGGSAPRNITSNFGPDFTGSVTTSATTSFLLDALKARIKTSPPVFPSGVNTLVLNIATLIPSEIAAINTSGDAKEMNFNAIGEIPGNIAGGIGTTQLSCPVGARPSPFNDARIASGFVLINKLPDRSLLVQPFINYKVKDTIDLCPGNCGALKEQVATVPMSKMEASGIAGDVPFVVNFPSKPIQPFSIPTPLPPTTKGIITASALRIRSAPDLSAPILDKYPRGTLVDLECQVTGSSVRGNTIWYQTNRGFISSEYVHLSGPAPLDC
ncbi:DUF4157 domain-containing protein [Membranicola marinus]|uniref:DUF4157 domain-containing protein n=1 Tax=Membranihabitans marinus TaxID=1227546 RepID=A0A953LBJ4_9BACT|nr:DUF4157 domain-containing protein [Membranihabitans marinus]MBY5956699.1 DUF4157 domain-containing protein [Membranihabitans marinus]